MADRKLFLSVMIFALAAGGNSSAQVSGTDVNQLMRPGQVFARVQDQAPRPTPTTTQSEAVVQGLARVKTYIFSTVDFPGASFSAVSDTNGTTTIGETDVDAFYSFSFHNGLYQTLAIPGSTSTSVSGINHRNQTVGTYFDSTGQRHGFFDDAAGNITNIDAPGALITSPMGINDAGLIVGTRQELSSEQGFLYNAGTLTDIDFPGFDTTANAINSSGVIVGTIFDNQGGSHGFVLRGGVFTQIDFPLAIWTEVLGINDGGELAGAFRDTNGVDHGFVYSHGIFSQVDVFGAKRTYLTRIKNSGRITGYFVDSLGEAHGMVGH